MRTKRVRKGTQDKILQQQISRNNSSKMERLARVSSASSKSAGSADWEPLYASGEVSIGGRKPPIGSESGKLRTRQISE